MSAADIGATAFMVPVIRSKSTSSGVLGTADFTSSLGGAMVAQRRTRSYPKMKVSVLSRTIYYVCRKIHTTSVLHTSTDLETKEDFPLTF